MPQTIKNSKLQESPITGKTILTWRDLLVVAFVAMSIVIGLIIPFVSEKIRYVLIFFVPAILAGVIILRNPLTGIYGFYLYSFLRPYDFIPALRPLRFTLVIELITLVSWLAKLAASKSKIIWDKFILFYLGFLGVLGITVITALNNFYAYQAFEAMLVLFVIFIISINVIKKNTELQTLIWILLLVHFYFAFKGFLIFLSGANIDSLGYATSGVVGRGFIGDENDFALVMNIMIPFAFFGIFHYKGWPKLICLILLIFFTLAVVSSFSRGGFVGLGCLLIYCILNNRRRFLSAAITVCLLLLIFIIAPSSYWEETKSIQEVDEGTADARIRYWKSAFNMYLDHPIVGVGGGNGGVHMPNYAIGYEDPDTQWGRAFHGTLPEVLAETGTLGSLFYLAMIIYIFKSLFKIKKQKDNIIVDKTSSYLANSLIGSLIAYFATAAFLSTAFYPYVWTLYNLSMILIIIQKKVAFNAPEPDSANLSLKPANY